MTDNDLLSLTKNSNIFTNKFSNNDEGCFNKKFYYRMKES